MAKLNIQALSKLSVSLFTKRVQGRYMVVSALISCVSFPTQPSCSSSMRRSSDGSLHEGHTTGHLIHYGLCLAFVVRRPFRIAMALFCYVHSYNALRRSQFCHNHDPLLPTINHPISHATEKYHSCRATYHLVMYLRNRLAHSCYFIPHGCRINEIVQG